jgi:predicted dehydrogenase
MESAFQAVDAQAGARTVGIVMNGVTGRMGTNQHLVRSILAIRSDGGVRTADGTLLVPDPILVGRDERRVAELARRHGLDRWTTSLDEALASDAEIYFDAQVTSARALAVRRALAAGKHVYVEKPVASDLGTSLDLARMAQDAGVVTGVVQDKLDLPGLRKLRRLSDVGFFGRILSVRAEFGYWVFEGDWQPPQRPSWNYRANEGGGIVLDMFPHWQYVLEGLVGRVRAVTCAATTHIHDRVDEQGEPYQATADDAAYAILELEGGAVAQINSSWAVRVHRDELVEFQVDGTEGSAVAGLHRCVAQHRVATPRPVWNPDAADRNEYCAQWQEVPDNEIFGNAFRVQWEHFLRHVADGVPFPADFLAGARGVQLAELALQSAVEGRRIEVPELTL